MLLITHDHDTLGREIADGLRAVEMTRAHEIATHGESSVLVDYQYECLLVARREAGLGEDGRDRALLYHWLALHAIEFRPDDLIELLDELKQRRCNPAR